MLANWMGAWRDIAFPKTGDSAYQSGVAGRGRNATTALALATARHKLLLRTPMICAVRNLPFGLALRIYQAPQDCLRSREREYVCVRVCTTHTCRLVACKVNSSRMSSVSSPQATLLSANEMPMCNCRFRIRHIAPSSQHCVGARPTIVAIPGIGVRIIYSSCRSSRIRFLNCQGCGFPIGQFAIRIAIWLVWLH